MGQPTKQLDTVTLTGTQLSDVFFNYQHADSQPDTIARDAKDFCSMIGRPDLQEALVQDFLNRV